MPASLPGATAAQNAANPSQGQSVLMDPLSGPKGAPFAGADTNLSTGALCTGIGFGSNHVIGPTAPASIKAAGFNDDYTPGVTLPNGNAAPDSRLTTIGGKRNAAPLLQAGNGGSRDAGSGSGFGTKMVTASATVANGAAIETGFTNRSGISLTVGQSAFGSSTTASPAP